MAKVVVREDPVLMAPHACEVPRWPSRVEFRLRGRQDHDARVGSAEGSPGGSAV